MLHKRCLVWFEEGKKYLLGCVEYHILTRYTLRYIRLVLSDLLISLFLGDYLKQRSIKEGPASAEPWCPDEWAYRRVRARRNIVDEDALAMVIRKGKLSGAALDVPRELDEIPALHEKFAGVKNILYTPNMSGGTRESMARAVAQMNKNVARLLNGEKPFYFVNDVWK